METLQIDLRFVDAQSAMTIELKYCPWAYEGDPVEVEIPHDEPHCEFCGGIMREVCDPSDAMGEVWVCLECGEHERFPCGGYYGSNIVEMSWQEYQDYLAEKRQEELLERRYGYVPKHIQDYWERPIP